MQSSKEGQVQLEIALVVMEDAGTIDWALPCCLVSFRLWEEKKEVSITGCFL